MKIAVIFHRKKFMVVVANDDTVQDLKAEISRVYKGLCPTCSSPPPVSEIQTHTGCVLFDGYTVSSVLSDNDTIIAMTGTTDSDGSPYAMPASVQGSPVYWPYYGFSPMATYSPMLATQMVYNSSPASSTLLPQPVAGSAPSSFLATPTKNLFQSPSTRTVSVQYPSPQRTESESENDISVCFPAVATPPSGVTAVERRTQAVETVYVHTHVGSNSHVLNAASGLAEEEPDLGHVSVEEHLSAGSTRTGGDIAVLLCSGGEDLCDSGAKQNEAILKKIEVALHDSGGKGTTTATPNLSRSAKKVGKRRTVQSLQSRATRNGGSTAAAGSTSPGERSAGQSLGSAVGRPRRVASQAASLRMQEIMKRPAGVNTPRDHPSPVLRKRMRGQSVGSEDEGRPEAKRKRNLEKDKTRKQSGNFRGVRAQGNSSETSSGWGSSDSEEDGGFSHSARKVASTKKVVDKQKPAKPSAQKGKTVPILVSSSDWTSSDEDDRREELRKSKLKHSNRTGKGRGGSQSDMSATERRSEGNSSMPQIMSPHPVNSTSESLPSQTLSGRAQHSGQTGSAMPEGVNPPSSSKKRTRPSGTQGKEQSKKGRSSRRKKGSKETPHTGDVLCGEEGGKTDVQQSIPHSDFEQQGSRSSTIPDSPDVTPEHDISSQGQEAHGGGLGLDTPTESVLDTQEGKVSNTTHGIAEEESAIRAVDEGAGDQAPHQAASETQDGNSEPEPSDQISSGQDVFEVAVRTTTSPSGSTAESLPSQTLSGRAQHSGQAGGAMPEGVDPPSSSKKRTRPSGTQGKEQSKKGRSSRRKKGSKETPHTEDVLCGEEGGKTDVQQSIPHSDLEQQGSRSSTIPDSPDVTSEHDISSQGQEAHGGVESGLGLDTPTESVLDTQEGTILNTTRGVAVEESAIRAVDEGAGDQAPHQAASETQDGNSEPEPSDQISSGQDVFALVDSSSNTVEEGSVEVLAAESVVEEEIVITAQLDEDAVTVIQETQEPSRSPSPEIPFVGQVETQPLSGLLSKQKVNEYVTLHDTHGASGQGEGHLPNGHADTAQASSDELSRGDSLAMGVASSHSDAQEDGSPSKRKRSKNIVTDLDLSQWESSDTAMSTNASEIMERSSGAARKKKKKSKRPREDQRMNGESAMNAKSANSVSSDALESGPQAKKKKRKERLSQVERTTGSSGENEMVVEVDNVTANETIPETQSFEPSVELENQDDAHTTHSTSHEESMKESSFIRENHTQSQNSDQSTLEPTQEKVEASHMEEEEDHEHLSVSESEAEQSRKRNVSDTTEGGPSGLQSEDVQSDGSCFMVEQPAMASELTATSVADMKSLRKRRKGKEKKRRKTLESHPPARDRPVATATKEAATRTERENISLATPRSQRKELKKKLGHSMTGVSSREALASSLSLNSAQGNGPSSLKSAQSNEPSSLNSAQGNGPSSFSGEKVSSRDMPTAPKTQKKSAANTSHATAAKSSLKLRMPTTAVRDSGVHSAWSPSIVTNTKKSKPKGDPLSVFSLTETEHSSEDSSGGEHSAIHARLKKPRKPSLLSALGNHGKKTKPSVLKSFKKGPSLPSTQRRFSSEAAIRMFSLTNSPHSAARKAKPHTIPKHLRSKKQKKELSVSVGDLSHKGQDGESLGDMPSLSELLADGSLWDS